nr:MAG TPA: holin [Caudoviricetes sp.]
MRNDIKIILIIQALDIIIKLPIVIKNKQLKSYKSRSGVFHKTGEWLSLLLSFVCDNYFKLNGVLISLNTKYITFSEIISCMENLQEYGINFNWLPDTYKNKLKGK